MTTQPAHSKEEPASGFRAFKRGRLEIHCAPGHDITVHGSNGAVLHLRVDEAHFVLTRLMEAMRTALEEQPLDRRGEDG